MLKWIAAILGVLLVGSWIFGWLFWGDAKEKIEKAENDLVEYQNRYSIIIEKGDSLESIIFTLRDEGAVYLYRIDSLKKEIVQLENEFQKGVVKVANLFQPDELVDEMKATYPALRNWPLGKARVPHPETGLKITVFQVPIHFVSTFIDDHNEMMKLRDQFEASQQQTFNYEKYVVLQDSIIVLKEEKAEEYKRGLDYGLQKYEELVKDYISTLKNPPEIGFPSFATIIAAGALGTAAGVLISK